MEPYKHLSRSPRICQKITPDRPFADRPTLAPSPFQPLTSISKSPKNHQTKPPSAFSPLQTLAPPPPPQVLVFGQRPHPTRSMPKARSPHWPQTIQSTQAN
ncbi:MAG: hypothetical protein BJG00_006185 [Limnothrix sp. CACIAM 69d]|nr:MAG: hypothetical protein BJG00_006185 [Limnothrix sp. CACIAM 69d]